MASSQGDEGVIPCGLSQAEKELIRKNPELAEKVASTDEKLKAHTKEYIEKNAHQRAGTIYTIPVVFHVVHDNGPENISRDQVLDAVQGLNENFRKLYADTTDIVNAFKSIAADTRIEFKLAQKDPYGNCTNGVTRTQSQETYNGDSDIKDLIQWPPDMYLNVWVAVNANGAAGYALKPGTAEWMPSQDGIVIKHDYVGTIGTSSSSHHGTLTHEVGHYLNLAHPWGDSNDPELSSNCNEDDGISDTPNTIGWTDCNLNGNSCNSLDNVQNFMEYAYCPTQMYTDGQKQVMRAALASSTANRDNLWKSSNLTATGTDGSDELCEADFKADKTIICQGESVSFSDMSYHGVDQWSWDFNGGNANATTTEDPVVTFDDAGSYTVSLTASKGGTNETEIKQDHIIVLDSIGSSLKEYFESVSSIPNNDFFVENPDGNKGWELNTSTGYKSSKSVWIHNNSNPAGNTDNLVTNTVDASQFNDLALAFDYAFAQSNSGDDDQLTVYASSNCGGGWSNRWQKSGSSLSTTSSTVSSHFTPSDSEWEHVVIDAPLVSSFHVKDLVFRFEFQSGGGNNVYIDNINVFDPSATTDLEETASSEPNLSVYPNPTDQNATVSFSLDRRQKVSLKLYDLVGREIQTLQQGTLNSGKHRTILERSGLKPGAYFIKLELEEGALTDRIFIE